MTDGAPSSYNHPVDPTQNNYRIVKDAYRLLGRKKFQEAILLLENVLSSGAGDIYVLLLLSVAYLHTDQFGKLARFITKMKEMEPAYLPLIHLEAFLKLKSAASREEAQRLYIELAARYPADPHVHRGKGLISDAGDFTTLQKEARLQDFVSVPRPARGLKKTERKSVYSGELGRRGIRISRGRRPVWRPNYGIAAIAAMAVVAAAGIWYGAAHVFSGSEQGMRKTRTDYGSVDMVSLSGTEYDLVKNIPADRVAVYYQSVRDVTADFDSARKLIKSGKYNDALYILNGLYNSNVNFVVKEKVDFLIRFVTDIDERDFDHVPFQAVRDRTYRYRGYAVRWKGAVERVRERDDSQILTMRMAAPDGGTAGEADVYSRRVVPGVGKGATILLEGVIVDFPGKERRPYIDARSIKIIE